MADINVAEVVPPDTSGAAVFVSRAAAQKLVIQANYLFKNHGVRPVRFSPHAMVRTPRRIHFRGHLLVGMPETAQDWGYVDLVPGRFLDDGQQVLVSEGYRSVDGDREWNEEVLLIFKLNPDLPRNAYYALQQEFGLAADKDGICQYSFTTRRALAYSYAQHVFDRTIGPNRMKVWISCSFSGIPDEIPIAQI
ncbi:MAG: hypothetical protein OXN84_00480 [Albidovulum sp.]|nr:hypothetical protein [Albidovulum sp.]